MINRFNKFPLKSVLQGTLFLWGWFFELFVPSSHLGPKGQAKHTEVHDPLLRGLPLGHLSGVSMLLSDSVLPDVCKAFQLNSVFQKSLTKMQGVTGAGLDKVKTGWTLLSCC